MLSKKFQKRIYDAYKANHEATIPHGNYLYSIAYNACASIHTWIIRRKRNDVGGDLRWNWLQPLDTTIN